MAEPTAETTETVEPERDEAREAVLAVLVEHLGDDVLDHHIRPGQGLWVRVATGAWDRAGEVARDRAGFAFFDFLSAVDWMPSPFGRYEDAATDVVWPPPMPERSAAVPGYTGGETRLQVIAGLARPGTGLRLFLRTDVPDDVPEVPSWTGLFRGADWHEREAWEMFGIGFAGHDALRHLYLPSGFEGNPLRKDFPLLARVVKPWPGIVDVEPMPGEADDGGEAGEADEASGDDGGGS